MPPLNEQPSVFINPDYQFEKHFDETPLFFLQEIGAAFNLMPVPVQLKLVPIKLSA